MTTKHSIVRSTGSVSVGLSCVVCFYYLRIWLKQAEIFCFFFHFLGYFIALKLSFDFYTCLYSKKKKCWWWIPKMMAFLHEDISQYAKVQFNIQPSILRNWALTHLPLTYVKKRHWYQELTLAVVARWFPVVIRKMNNIFVCFCFLFFVAWLSIIRSSAAQHLRCTTQYNRMICFTK